MRILAVLALTFILDLTVHAQRQTFTVDSDSSEIRMKLNTTHEVVNGTFRVKSGSIDFRRNDPDMSGSIVVATATGDTGNGGRDKKMKKDILKEEQFATVSFEPRRYTGTIAASGDSSIQARG